MKRVVINTIIFIFGMVTLVACKKDEITIQKNDNVTWQIEEDIINDDIRTRIGYDPREQQAYFRESEADLPVITFGNVPISGENTVTVTLNLTQKVTEDTKVSLLYDATLYDKIKENYAGFQLAEANTVTLTKSEVIIAKGNKSVDFSFSIANTNSLNKKYILPYKLKVPENKAKILKGSETFVLKVYPNEVNLSLNPTYESRNVTVNVITNEYAINNEKVEFTIATNVKIPSNISVGLVRDNTISYPGYTTAPTGIEPIIDKKSFANVERVNFSFKLQNIHSLVTKGNYLLPLRLVVYDENGNIYPTQITPLVVISLKAAYPKDNVLGSNSVTVPSGDKITGITGQFTNESFFGGGSLYFNRMIDGNLTNYAFLNKGYTIVGAKFDFPDQKRLKTIRIKLDASTPKLSMVRVKIGESSIGVATFNSSTNWYVITLKHALTVSGVELIEFIKDNQRESFKINEVEFYEE